MTTPKILAFAGSTRKDSFNKKLIKIAVEGARTAGAAVTLIDLRDFPLPIYDGDLEADEGLPANCRKLKDIFFAHQGLMISSPEYNSSISGVLKNIIDWVSRPVPNESPLQAFDGKVAALMSASPGALGGLRGLVTLRSILGNIKVFVLPDQTAVPKANDAFREDGRLNDEKQHASVAKLGENLANILMKLNR